VAAGAPEGARARAEVTSNAKMKKKVGFAMVTG